MDKIDELVKQIETEAEAEFHDHERSREAVIKERLIAEIRRLTLQPNGMMLYGYVVHSKMWHNEIVVNPEDRFKYPRAIPVYSRDVL